MTAADIQRRLILDRYRQTFVLKNYTPAGWFECDVFEVTAAGYFREYEIKISRGDFKNDAAKAKSKFNFEQVDGRGRFVETRLDSKHQQLAANSTAGPVQFWFVYPEGLVKLDEVPLWAGVIEMNMNHGKLPYGVERRPAPRRHGQKIPQTTMDHARSSCYWRMTRLFLHEPQEPDKQQIAPKMDTATQQPSSPELPEASEGLAASAVGAAGTSGAGNKLDI